MTINTPISPESNITTPVEDGSIIDISSEVKNAVDSVNVQTESLELLRELLHNDEACENIIKLRTTDEREAIENIKKDAKKIANKKILELKNVIALQLLGETDLNVARKRGKEWGMALKSVTQVDLSVDGEIQTMTVEEASLYYYDIEINEREAELQDLNQALQSAESENRLLLNSLREDLKSRQNDPQLLDALSIWGKSPNAKGERGDDGEGFHSGIIHYFEYRAYKDKAGRFHNEAKDALSIDGFINYSSRLKPLIQTGADLSSMPEVESFARFSDEYNQERLFIMTTYGTIVAFRSETDEMLKIKTVLANSSKARKNIKRFGKMVKAEATEIDNPHNYLSFLGTERQLIESDPQTGELLSS